MQKHMSFWKSSMCCNTLPQWPHTPHPEINEWPLYKKLNTYSTFSPKKLSLQRLKGRKNHRGELHSLWGCTCLPHYRSNPPQPKECSYKTITTPIWTNRLPQREKNPHIIPQKYTSHQAENPQSTTITPVSRKILWMTPTEIKNLPIQQHRKISLKTT